MSRDLLSVHGTPYEAELTHAELCSLSRWELVNFFSFNVHGIRELMLSVIGSIYTPGFEHASEYFHHFLGEENKHMWFFAEFCKRYGGKIYMNKRMPLGSPADAGALALLTFSKILVSEEISDFYNVRMMADPSLPDIIRDINRAHHEDETRHITMGRKLVKILYRDFAATRSKTEQRDIEGYISRYLRFFTESFYNPTAYRDAGLAEPYGLRNALIRHPARAEFHRRVLKRPITYFQNRGVSLGDPM